MPTTEAWVLHAGPGGDEPPSGSLLLEAFSFPDINDQEVLVEPLFGSWEANISHAIERRPIDVCLQRKEERVVLCNCGVVRVLEIGSAVAGLDPGDVCLFYGTGRYDAFGYMELAHAYDAPHTIGLLAKRTKIAARNLFRIPRETRHSLAQWAVFSAKYITAWSNWRVAHGAFRLQIDENDVLVPYVWGWGGGTTLAELDLARRWGCAATMIVGHDERSREATTLGLDTLDRRAWPALQFDRDRYQSDALYRQDYSDSENAFLAEVRKRTGGLGVSIFLDYIGAPVLRASLRALARQGVYATAGWKRGMSHPLVRAVECIQRHTHVFTHYGRWSEAPEAMSYGEQHGWMPSVKAIFQWERIPELARRYRQGDLHSYFPVFQVNSV